MISTHRDAESRYTLIRRAIIDETNKSLALRGMAQNEAKLIDHTALSASTQWDASPNRRKDWDWIQGYHAFKFRYPKRFEMALWHQGKLASLTLGRPTYNGHRMRMDFIEGAPDNPPDLKVFSFSLIAIEAYAEAIGAREVRIMNPVNDEVRRYYEGYGLIWVPEYNYLYGRL